MIGAFWSVWLAGALVAEYISHMPNEDQANVGFGLLMLHSWRLPSATIPMLLAIVAKPTLEPPAREPRDIPRWMSIPLLASGWLLLVFAALEMANQVPRLLGDWRHVPLFDLLMVTGSAGMLVGCAAIWIALGRVAVRSAPVLAPRHLPTVFLLTVVSAMIWKANVIQDGIQVGDWRVLARNLFLFCVPNFVLIVLLVQRAWILSRQGGMTAPSSGVHPEVATVPGDG